MKLKNSGYTILEFLIIIAILVVLAYISVREFNNYIKHQRLISAEHDLVSLINWCKNISLISNNTCGFCVSNATTIIFFKDLNKNARYDANDAVLKIFDITQTYPSVSIKNASSNIYCNQMGLVFDRNGKTLSSGIGGVSLTLKNTLEQTREITVSSFGRILGE
jgi:Tfp pilus assembly protein FimT